MIAQADLNDIAERICQKCKFSDVTAELNLNSKCTLEDFTSPSSRENE